MTGVGGRPEVVIEGSNNMNSGWKEYEFLYKPGNTSRGLPIVGECVETFESLLVSKLSNKSQLFVIIMLCCYSQYLISAPHQPRLDWQMWFAALGSYQHNPWFLNLVYRLLNGEKAGSFSFLTFIAFFQKYESNIFVVGIDLLWHVLYYFCSVRIDG